jgi:hypothetical protein
VEARFYSDSTNERERWLELLNRLGRQVPF